MDKPIIKIQNLKQEFKTSVGYEQILKGLTFNIFEGKITTILGPSGSGKTTLLNILSGLARPSFGLVSFENTDITKLNDVELTKFRLNNLGFIFQHYNLITELNVKENILLSLELTNKSNQDLDEIIKMVGLEKAVDKFPGELSGGMQQRVAIARALVTKPKFLICDEPTGALDENTGKDILTLLQNINLKYQTTIILVTHNPGIQQMSDYIIQISSGTIISYLKNNNVVQAKNINWA